MISQGQRVGGGGGVPVQEAFYLIWQVIVYNQFYIGNVQAPSCHVCCYKDRELVVTEIVQNLLTLSL